MHTIHEENTINVIHTADVCVLGGSCTGVFAAVRAAQAGLSVAIVENNAFFGGVATAGLVNIWHSLWDTENKRQIIGGLTHETVQRLKRRDAADVLEPNEHLYAVLNTAELACELDELIREQRAPDGTPRIRPFLHARFAAPHVEDGRMTAAIIEDKSGRRAIRAPYFIDATGDGDVIARLGLPFTLNDDPQPPTVCCYLTGLDEVIRRNPGFDLQRAAHDPRFPNALKQGTLWSSRVPGAHQIAMVAGTRAHGADCSDADQLTGAEMECRRQARAIRDILRGNFAGGEDVSVAAVSSYIGIRESRHATCLHRLTETEVLEGVRFPDAIANGSYRVDVHHSNRAGITFRYLDGSEVYSSPEQPWVKGRWRDERAVNPTFYQIPYRSLVPDGAKNVLAAGRLIDADRGAYGAIRVMVNCNQTGEAAGLACALALDAGADVAEIDTARLREQLVRQGAIVI